MPPDPTSLLREILSSELSQTGLDTLAREFYALAQDRRETLVFFVLANVCEKLSSALQGEAVSWERFQELTANIAAQMIDVIRSIDEGKPSQASLEQLANTLYQNLGLFRS